MTKSRLATPDPAAFRYAVYACSSKIDLSTPPDPAVALFDRRGVAESFGRLMWPSTFEVVDLAEATV
ncbi:hypothetical protein SAMN05216197_1455 [Pseudomonas graminis]|uniref:Uncharacterized protein n=1 Tax=Pseudomonas graminis TaxID=158627 RepID=A0A1I0IZG5_9PSED|nr:hypothetical protein [Pseudomonas graminis]SEU02816.1 hypothetical protein SAMN05216197_1455 [Pseudomonas graminis]